MPQTAGRQFSDHRIGAGLAAAICTDQIDPDARG
jgi:hypothetical protein